MQLQPLGFLAQSALQVHGIGLRTEQHPLALPHKRTPYGVRQTECSRYLDHFRPLPRGFIHLNRVPGRQHNRLAVVGATLYVAHTLDHGSYAPLLVGHSQSVGGQNPHVLPSVLHYSRHMVARQLAVLRSIVVASELPAGAIHTPHAVVGVIHPHVVARTEHPSVGFALVVAPGVVHEAPSGHVVAGEVERRGVYPEQTVGAVFIQIAHVCLNLLRLLVAERVEVDKRISVISAQSVGRSHPHKAVFVLNDVVYGVARQSVCRRDSLAHERHAVDVGGANGEAGYNI